MFTFLPEESFIRLYSTNILNDKFITQTLNQERRDYFTLVPTIQSKISCCYMKSIFTVYLNFRLPEVILHEREYNSESAVYSNKAKLLILVTLESWKIGKLL